MIAENGPGTTLSVVVGPETVILLPEPGKPDTIQGMSVRYSEVSAVADHIREQFLSRIGLADVLTPATRRPA